MKKLYILWFLLLSVGVHAQSVQWKARFGGRHAEYLFDGLPTLDYGFLMVGGSLSSGTGDVAKRYGDFDGFAVKIDEYGSLEYTRNWGGTRSDIIRCIANTNDGGYLLAAESNSPVSGNKQSPLIGRKDTWLIKIDITGNQVWQRTVGGVADDVPVRVMRTADGGYLLLMTSGSDALPVSDTLRHHPAVIPKETPAYGNNDFWVVKLDARARKEWEITLGGKYDDRPAGAVELPDGSFVVGGTSNSPVSGNKSTANEGNNDWWIVALSGRGTILWQKTIGGASDDELRAVAWDRHGRIVLGGSLGKTDKKGKITTDFALVMMDPQGRILRKKTYDQADRDILTDLTLNRDGTFLLSGYARSVHLRMKAMGKMQDAATSGNDDYLVIKTDSTGKEKWRNSYGSPGHDILQRTLELRDGGYVLMGTSLPLHSRHHDANFLIYKLDDKDKKVHPKLPLEAIPNPAGDYTRIVIGRKYKKGSVRISDLHGRLLQSFELHGRRIVPVRLPYPPGIYIIQVKADDARNSVKVIKS